MPRLTPFVKLLAAKRVRDGSNSVAHGLKA